MPTRKRRQTGTGSWKTSARKWETTDRQRYSKTSAVEASWSKFRVEFGWPHFFSSVAGFKASCLTQDLLLPSQWYGRWLSTVDCFAFLSASVVNNLCCTYLSASLAASIDVVGFLSCTHVVIRSGISWSPRSTDDISNLSGFGFLGPVVRDDG